MSSITPLRHATPTVVLAPGLGDSGPQHWQSLWQQQNPEFRRVVYCPWEEPDLEVWSNALRRVIASVEGPVVVVAHSFGCLATIHAVQQGESRIVAALLVAPADPERFGFSSDLEAPIDLPGLILASSNDPWMSSAKARQWAGQWQLPLVDMGPLGHINAASELGGWPQGKKFLNEILDEAASSSALSSMTYQRHVAKPIYEKRLSKAKNLPFLYNLSV
jgi:predicted alpha/beta hydrolase family esterase